MISQLTKCSSGEIKFTFVLNDSSGNSFIENPDAPKADPLMTITYYTRDPEQDAQLGIQPASDEAAEEEEDKGALSDA